jgi:hypothetical protein
MAKYGTWVHLLFCGLVDGACEGIFMGSASNSTRFFTFIA